MQFDFQRWAPVSAAIFATLAATQTACAPEEDAAPGHPCAGIEGASLQRALGAKGEFSFDATSPLAGFPEVPAWSAAVADVNDDGWPDIFAAEALSGAVRGRTLVALNCRGEAFSLVDISADTEAAGTALRGGPLVSTAAPLDIDEDGDIDFVAADVAGVVEAWVQGDGLRFERHLLWQADDLPEDRIISPSGIRPVDFDGDGHFEIYLSRNWADNASHLIGPENVILRPSGELSYENANDDYLPLLEMGRRRTFDAIYAPPPPAAAGDPQVPGLFMLINDFGPDGLFTFHRIDGQAIFREIPVPTLSGVEYTLGMGGDHYIEDGEHVVAVSDIGRVTLYRVGADSRVVAETPTSLQDPFHTHVYWGIAVRDFDLDGQRDIISTGSRTSLDLRVLAWLRESYPLLIPREHAVFWKGLGGGEYQALDAEAGPFFDPDDTSIGDRDFSSMQHLDLRRDGCVDGVAVPMPLTLGQAPWYTFSSPMRLVQNDGCDARNAWVGFDLRDPTARVEVRVNGRSEFSAFPWQSGPFSASLGFTHLGLGERPPGELNLEARVHWGDGSVTDLGAIAPDRYHRIR